MESFKKIANAEGHQGYRNKNNIFAHTVDNLIARILVRGYLKILDFNDFKLNNQNSSVDIGCGAGYITSEFKNNGFNIKGLEYSDDALSIAKELNPSLDIEFGDMSKFREENKYDFIFSREVYLITRVNCFTEQKNIISNIVDSLKRGGVYLCW